MAATTATAAHSWKDQSINDGSCGDGTSPDSTITDATTASSIEVPLASTESYGVPRDDGISMSSSQFTEKRTGDKTLGASATTTIAPQVAISSPDDRGGKPAEEASLSTSSDPVDSALQAALREPRERLALLRLESLLVDFCRTESAGWLEVSGLYNATWIGPQLTGRPQGSGGGGGSGGAFATGTGVDPLSTPTMTGPYGYGPSLPMAHPMGLAGQPSAPRPATSFQRCVLHRLADRFGIVRDSGSVMEGSIRLIKVPETKIPTKLLQDMDPSEYSLEAVTAALSQANLGEPRFAPTQHVAAAPGVDASSQNPTFSGPAGVLPNPRSARKMKIMKRSENRSRSSTPSHSSATATGNSSAGSRRDSAGGGRSSLGSDLTERERAYAEARARIFQDSEDGTSPAVGNSVDADRAGQSSDFGGTASTLDDVDDPTVPVSTPALAFAAAAAASTGHRRSPLNSSHTNPKEGESGSSCVEGNAAMTTENKATYRNRMEEAADPDFKRGVVVAVQQVQYISAVPTNPMPHGAQTPASYSQHYQPHMVTPEYSSYTPALVTGYPYGPYATAPNGPTIPSSHFPSLHSTVDSSRTAAGAVTPSAGRTSLPKLAASAPAFYPSWASAAGAASSAAATSMATAGGSTAVRSKAAANQR